ncbi:MULTISPECIES: hypothetical protein [Streptomyces]|uniref:hypothetical protein n=1 Tax=Streptomyces TaxID=1883 RepID=UPI00224927FA|nr:hypothetical protein [Streptomyces sp. JHD 1]MCX2968212.1 hypothetical protein [Streptomyces sp. JHD 1]
MGGEERCVVELRSAGRGLAVDAPAALVGSWWPQVAPHLPGVAPGGVPVAARAGVRPVAVPGGAGMADVRRWLGAYLHRLHLAHGTLCAHAVCVQPPDGGGAVVLLGGHGAGKTLVALALAGHGWRVLAGDVALLDCSDGDRPSVLGGTRAMVVRCRATARWFAELGLPPEGSAVVEVSDRPGLAVAAPGGPVAVAAGLVVDVDGGLSAADAAPEPVDRHTAANTWLRASGHLLDRVLETPVGPALREVEDHPAHLRRLAFVRTLAGRLPLYAVSGTPERIAAHAARLAAGHQRAPGVC